ncbi:LysR family transcriptional regulator [Bradyrhizobium pachyrhizi]|uniref:LysR family transcriptional regulator n=1 Tax=Bradyrhizobium pachyrhizi TaxID=280333 RepID=UPI0007C64F14|nr:LysR family transcriptional regulator [Bradyrhizobium pachyrhizi]
MTEANWDLFRLFSTVTKTGSVNRAARQLGMSQPTLSRRLKELERYVGAPLFFRISTGVKLTQEGEELRRSADEMVRSFESFNKNISARVNDRSSAVKISATEGLTKHWLLPRMTKLRAQYNQLRIEITSTISKQNLAASDLDFVLRMGHPGDDDLVGKRVASVEFGLFASASYLSGRSAPRSLDELPECELVSTPMDFVDLQGERAGQMMLLTRFKNAAEASNGLRIMPLANHFSAVGQGLGIAFLAVPFALAEGLVRVLPQEAANMDLWLLRRRESDLRKMTRQVRRFLETELSESRSWFQGKSGIRKDCSTRPSLSLELST